MRLNKILSLSIMASISLFGADSLENVLSDSRNKSFDLNLQKAEQDSQKSEKDWINAITLKLDYTADKLTQGIEDEFTTGSISISQPIFKSGGITSQINLAKANLLYSQVDVALAKKMMIKDAVTILFQLKQLDLKIEKQKLVVANAQLDVKTKQEQVIYGVMDASFLDNAIIDTNSKQTGLIDLETEKENLINKFKNYSDKNYATFALPVLSIVSEESFIQNNNYIQKNANEIAQKHWTYKLTNSKYLPSVNANYSYNHYFDHDGLNDAYYGVSVSMPLDIKYNNDIQSTKISYMKAKLDSDLIKLEEQNLYKTKIEKIKNIDKKIELAKKDMELYKNLVFQVKELSSVGLKTITDAQILENSLRIKSMDENIFAIDKQIEMLELYARYSA